MRFAYADPPYPGQSKRWYGDHPDYAGEVDHAELIGRLCRDYPDGWALSTNAVSLPALIRLCPDNVKIAAWHNINSQPPGAVGGWWWTWEPVIVRGGRAAAPVRNLLSCPPHTAPGRFAGSKPPEFTRWMLALLGAERDDTIDDLFPGSGAVAAAIEAWRRQPELHVWSPVGTYRAHRRRMSRDMRLSGNAGLF